jgi:ribosome biogenesis GTPase
VDVKQPASSADPALGALGEFGWNPSVSERYEPFDAPGSHLVRLVRVDRTSCVVVTHNGLAACRHGRRKLSPVTGDWAVGRVASDGELTLSAVLPRTTAVVRRNPTATGDQVLVANVDAMFVLHGIDRPHRVGRLERLAILSWEAGVPPVIVLTKIDLAGTDGAVIGVDDAIAEINRVVHDIEVIPTSTVTGEGFDRLGTHLGPGRTVGVVGESGAGKSSLVNHLAGDAIQSVGRTRPGDHKGRHTTTSRDLVPIPSGAVLVDTPGLRSISMPVAEEGLARAYADLEVFTDECKFRDCTHDVEPGCGITAALEDGRLPAERWAGYLKLQQEMAAEAGRSAARERRAATRDSRRRRPPETSNDQW